MSFESMPVSSGTDRHFLFNFKLYLIRGSVIHNLRGAWNSLFLQQKLFITESEQVLRRTNGFLTKLRFLFGETKE